MILEGSQIGRCRFVYWKQMEAINCFSGIKDIFLALSFMTCYSSFYQTLGHATLCPSREVLERFLGEIMGT
jgi:hypothetical protein